MADAPPTNLIALRDGKRAAETLITERYAEGLIDGDDLERRLELVQDAETMTALERLIVDLVEPGTAPSTALVPRAQVGAGSSLAIGSATAGANALARLDDIAPERQFTALFSSVEQVGRWTPARHNRVIDVFGEATLDLREAMLGPGPTIIDIRCVFASLVLIVPPGLAVRIETSATVAASVERDEHISEQPRGPDEPVIVIQGILVFASLEIHDRLPGEGRRDARRRHRAARKAAKRERRALASGRKP